MSVLYIIISVKIKYILCTVHKCLELYYIGLFYKYQKLQKSFLRNIVDTIKNKI